MTLGTVQRSIFSSNAKLARFVKAGQYQRTLALFQQMERVGMKLDTFSFVPALTACAKLGALDEGKRIHKQTRESGCELDVYVGGSLVQMYSKCGHTEDARSVFEKMPQRNLVAWNVMILGYAKSGKGKDGLELFQQMQKEGVVVPDAITFVGLLNACAATAELETGRRIHKMIVGRNLESNSFVGNALVDMYCKCGRMEDAWSVFQGMKTTRDVVTWTAMIQGFLSCGRGEKAVEFSQLMRQQGVDPDFITYAAILNACASTGALDEGRSIHRQVRARGFESIPLVGNSLIDMYVKCESMDEAGELFCKMPTRDVVAWTTMIFGYCKCGQGQVALELYSRMQAEGLQADAVTFVAVLNACACVGALQVGRQVHEQILAQSSRYESDVSVGASLVDMYAKCGDLGKAEAVFCEMTSHNQVSWTTMLGGYALHGRGNEALCHFERMCREGVPVDEVTFVSLLSACCHAGLVEEGQHYFKSMSSKYGIVATVDHYACMVDLLGRAGRLQEAEEMITVTYPSSCKSNAIVWKSLLSACRVHGSSMEIGERAAEQVLHLDPRKASGYVLLSNLYAAAGKWDSRANTIRQRFRGGVGKKTAGLTWIEINDSLHSFKVDDDQHPRINEIRAELERLSEQIKESGYRPDMRFVLHDVEEGEKASKLLYHSEKLGVAFGLISTPPGTPLRLFKNLRICGDCHSAIEFISKAVGRKIVVRDATRFHHFEHGACSCKGYW